MTHPNAPEAARRRLAGYRAGQHIDHLREDQALNNTIGQGIGYGFAAAAAELAPEFVALRLAGGLRWVGATRTATVVSRLSRAEGYVGVRAGWQELRKAPVKFALDATERGVFDYGMQSTANFITGEEQVFSKVNFVESGMAAWGLKPWGIGVGSAAVSWNSVEDFRSVAHPDAAHRIHPATFAAQAFIGTGMGLAGQHLERRLFAPASQDMALALYEQAALRLGRRVSFPLGLGFYRSSLKSTEYIMGVTEESLEGQSGNAIEDWLKTSAPDSLHQP